MVNNDYFLLIPLLCLVFQFLVSHILKVYRAVLSNLVATNPSESKRSQIEGNQKTTSSSWIQLHLKCGKGGVLCQTLWGQWLSSQQTD